MPDGFTNVLGRQIPHWRQNEAIAIINDVFIKYKVSLAMYLYSAIVDRENNWVGTEDGLVGDTTVWKRKKKNGKLAWEVYLKDFKVNGDYPYRKPLEIWGPWRYCSVGRVQRLLLYPQHNKFAPELFPGWPCHPYLSALRFLKTLQWAVATFPQKTGRDIACKQWPIGNMKATSSTVINKSTGRTVGDSEKSMMEKHIPDAWKRLVKSDPRFKDPVPTIESYRTLMLSPLITIVGDLSTLDLPPVELRASDPETAWLLPPGSSELVIDLDDKWTMSQKVVDDNPAAFGDDDDVIQEIPDKDEPKIITTSGRSDIVVQGGNNDIGWTYRVLERLA